MRRCTAVTPGLLAVLHTLSAQCTYAAEQSNQKRVAPIGVRNLVPIRCKINAQNNYVNYELHPETKHARVPDQTIENVLLAQTLEPYKAHYFKTTIQSSKGRGDELRR